MPSKKSGSTKKSGNLSGAGRTLGKKGGKTGGPARAKSLSSKERSAIASKGGKARQAKGK